MTSSILFCGQEDVSFSFIGTAFNSSVTSNGQYGIDTTASHFRSDYARYAIGFNGGLPSPIFARTQPSFSSSNFWTSARNWSNINGANGATPTSIRWLDSGGVERLRIQ